MSRKRDGNDMVTQKKRVRYGKRVVKGMEPVALVGPENNKDTLTLAEFAEALYGEGTKCFIVPPPC